MENLLGEIKSEGHKREKKKVQVGLVFPCLIKCILSACLVPSAGSCLTSLSVSHTDGTSTYEQP